MAYHFTDVKFTVAIENWLPRAMNDKYAMLEEGSYVNKWHASR